MIDDLFESSPPTVFDSFDAIRLILELFLVCFRVIENFRCESSYSDGNMLSRLPTPMLLKLPFLLNRGASLYFMAVQV